MEIIRLQSVSDAQIDEILGLMQELDPEIRVTPEMIRQTASEPRSCLFALVDGVHIVGCATLCIFFSPTGCKAHIEDVVVSSSYRGQQLGRRLVAHLIDYARAELKAVDIYLTSRPHRAAANALYQSLGFRLKETNVYKLEVR